MWRGESSRRRVLIISFSPAPLASFRYGIHRRSRFHIPPRLLLAYPNGIKHSLHISMGANYPYPLCHPCSMTCVIQTYTLFNILVNAVVRVKHKEEWRIAPPTLVRVNSDAMTNVVGGIRVGAHHN